jgi:STE24 endopeptidase
MSQDYGCDPARVRIGPARHTALVLAARSSLFSPIIGLIRVIRVICGLVCLLLVSTAHPAFAQSNSSTITTTTPAINIETATRAYLDRMSPEKKHRSDAYFEGGYWLQLWDFLYGLAVAGLLLSTRLSARMRDLSVRITRFKALQLTIYWLQYLMVVAFLGFPLAVYEGYFREHQYGMSNQTLGGWFWDFVKGQMVALVMGSIALIPIFALVRRRPNDWHLAASIVAIVFLALGIVISPIFIAPLFNKYTLLTDAKVRDPILRLARANGIPAKEVYQMDASRQTKRISANVSGAFGTTRITLNDNLLNRSTPASIEAVMGHEMGHYVLNHVYKMLAFMSGLVIVMMAFLRWSLARFIARFGPRWGITGPADPAVLPLAIALISACAFVLTPLKNTLVRTQEMEADFFGLNAARQPDGFAEAALQLSEYRKMEPGPIEEWIFFDHPSGATRIHTAMRWKAENLPGN